MLELLITFGLLYLSCHVTTDPHKKRKKAYTDGYSAQFQEPAISLPAGTGLTRNKCRCYLRITECSRTGTDALVPACFSTAQLNRFHFCTQLWYGFKGKLQVACVGLRRKFAEQMNAVCTVSRLVVRFGSQQRMAVTATTSVFLLLVCYSFFLFLGLF